LYRSLSHDVIGVDGEPWREGHTAYFRTNIRQLSAPGPWAYDKLASMIEQGFRPAANGLAPSLFASQVTAG
jgi:hypothetical protein